MLEPEHTDGVLVVDLQSHLWLQLLMIWLIILTTSILRTLLTLLLTTNTMDTRCSITRHIISITRHIINMATSHTFHMEATKDMIMALTDM